MFRMRRCSPTFLKLTTICDFSHVISSTRPLFFPTREEGLGTRLGWKHCISHPSNREEANTYMYKVTKYKGPLESLEERRPRERKGEGGRKEGGEERKKERRGREDKSY